MFISIPLFLISLGVLSPQDITSHDSYQWVQQFVEQFGYVGIFFLLFVVAAAPVFPIPEDFVLLIIGYMIAYSWIDPFGSLILSIVTVVVADFALYGMGKWGGKSIPQLKFLRFLNLEKRMITGEQWIQRYGIYSIVLARVIPGPRTYIYMSLGLLKYPFAKYAWVNGLAILLHVPFLIGLGYLFHEQMSLVFEWIMVLRNWILALIGALALFFILYWIYYRMKKKRLEKPRNT